MFLRGITQTRERSDWHSPADWNSSDETRERTDCRQMIGTAQIQRVSPRDGSHTILGNEVIFIDPHKGVHGNENDACL